MPIEIDEIQMTLLVLEIDVPVLKNLVLAWNEILRDKTRLFDPFDQIVLNKLTSPCVVKELLVDEVLGH